MVSKRYTVKKNIDAFISILNALKLSAEKLKTCDNDKIKKHLYNSMKNRANNEFPGNDCFKREFYKKYCDLI